MVRDAFALIRTQAVDRVAHCRNPRELTEHAADIERETQDLRVVVVPEINAGTAALAYAVINPAIGLDGLVRCHREQWSDGRADDAQSLDRVDEVDERDRRALTRLR